MGITRFCQVLGVARSGYYDWKKRGESRRSRQDRELLARIRDVHRASREAYGAVKTWYELKSQGITCGKHRVARLRRQAGIEARRKRRFRVTMENHHTTPAAPNLVQRRFCASLPNQIWVGDGTFIRTRQGFLHLAVLLDLNSRRVVGWGMGERPNLAPVMVALDIAVTIGVRDISHFQNQTFPIPLGCRPHRVVRLNAQQSASGNRAASGTP